MKDLIVAIHDESCPIEGCPATELANQLKANGGKVPLRQVSYRQYAENFDTAFPKSPKRRREAWSPADLN